MKNWIGFPRVEGVATRQAHVALPPGTFEREVGREGFFGPATQIHHAHPPTAWESWEGDLRPRAFDTVKAAEMQASPFDAYRLMGNGATQVRFWRFKGKMDHLVRNADGDELLFFHQGGGHLYCDYGHMEVFEGDYVILPRSTAWRLESDTPVGVLMIEATNDAYQLPYKGLVGNHAIFDEAMLEAPRIDDAFNAQKSEQRTTIRIKRNNRLSAVTFPFNPLDAVGWHGNLAPVRLNWRDIRPLMSHRYHLPPSAHCTWVSSRFIICTFVPRPIESDPEALKLPYYHSNDDYDEVLFYHRGQFFSRDNIHPGMITYHPAGFPHGPHPKAFEVAQKYERKETDEVAVMLDTRDPLTVLGDLEKVEWAGYVDSWKAKP
ncbi:homogentisate 1,2-dioxygenase [Azospirillum sp. TSO22-1]|uniref:homogentisate 1,2-dioxygenase n=1 Tax=Azospirillum sp. TSO22-1 TaxID=716789 RepID=UPI000D6144AC|nr:homogentisate 1,2-dioxygenase [Azospirillum sp. TSO22-1]PWC45904.1 dioxygenase [Azospirillum sp. TSO22-1]